MYCPFWTHYPISDLNTFYSGTDPWRALYLLFFCILNLKSVCVSLKHTFLRFTNDEQVSWVVSVDKYQSHKASSLK